MFIFHDETQPARLQEFALNLRTFHIPPRLAPDFSFKLGYPVFNFYAPASYWITSIFTLMGGSVLFALKLSFLLSILVGLVASYLFLREYFDFFPSLTGAVLYISSLYYPLNIFVRGNLGEAWFLALFPLALLFLEKNAKQPTASKFFFSALVLLLVFTVHNLLSAVSVALLFIFILLRPHKKINMAAFVTALLLSSYFLIPLLFEHYLTYATYVAAQTKYADHFVCPYQLWQSPWGYGGSIPGCDDGMSFKIGKIQLIFFVFGLIFFIGQLLKRKKILHLKTFIFFLSLTVGSLFMTTYLSQFVWDLFAPILSLFQFPWRFIAFSLLGIGFFSAYFFHTIQFRFKNIFLIILLCFVVINQSKYFTGIYLWNKDFEKTFLSKDYIEKMVAYTIAEYLPKTADYSIWREYDPSKKQYQSIPFDYFLPAQTNTSQLTVGKNTAFDKEFYIDQPDGIYLNIHYFPFWNIKVNGKTINPTKFDELGRPIIELKTGSKVTVNYMENPIEKIGDFITLFTFGILLYIIKSKKLWNKLST